jgi:hypothetical protein
MPTGSSQCGQAPPRPTRRHRVLHTAVLVGEVAGPTRRALVDSGVSFGRYGLSI